MKHPALTGLCVLLLGICAGGVQAQQAADPAPVKPAPKPAKAPSNSYLQMAAHLVAAGDLNGDGRDEVVVWDKETKQLAVFDYSSGAPKSLTVHDIDGYPTTLAVADVDGDGKDEVLLGEGLPSPDPADVMKSEVRLRLYRPLSSSGWTPTEIFHGPSERPDMGDIQTADLDGDRKPEVLFRYFVSKYFVNTGIARRDGKDWKVELLDSIRMGMNVATGPVFGSKQNYIVVGRPYGEPEKVTDPKTGKVTEKPTVGDAFVLRDGVREALPVTRGVSAVAVGNVSGDGAPEIVVGDGWHSDYGKMARSRLAVLSRDKDLWGYEFIEDLPGFIRFIEISLVDLDRDGKDEIIALAEQGSTAATLRLYQHTASGWRGATLAVGSTGFAVANLKGDRARELVLSGAQPKVQPLDLQHISWDTKLAEARETVLVDPKSLIGKTAPEVEVEEWIGEAQSLAALRGRVVLLDYWATWCGPCIKTFPALTKMLETYQGDGFSIVGLTNHSSQTSADVRKFLKKTPLAWPVGIDGQNRPHLAYGTGSIPHQVLIDRKGVVRAYYVGGERDKEIEADVKKLLAERE